MLSIDKIVKEKNNIDISRNINIASSQIKADYYIYNKNKLKNLEKKDYILIEDDIDTGGTINFIKEYINIKDIIVLNELVFPNIKFDEVIDLRDIIFGSKTSGIRNIINNKKYRSPYLLPFTSVIERMNIPFGKDIEKIFLLIY